MRQRCVSFPCSLRTRSSQLTSTLLSCAQPDDYSRLRERQLLYIVSVPGETDWLKQVRSCSPSSPPALADSPPSQNLDGASLTGTSPAPQPTHEEPADPLRADLQNSVDRLSLDASQAAPSSSASSSKHPNPAEPHFGLVAKVRRVPRAERGPR